MEKQRFPLSLFRAVLFLFLAVAVLTLVSKVYAEDADIAELKAKAEQGDAEAQCDLGAKYLAGKGVRQDSAEAVKWWRKAAEQGHGLAQHNLGCMYAQGEGVLKDSAEALKWFRKAADQGTSYAQYALWETYAKGEGVPKNSVEAVKWCRKAAEQGYTKAQSKLGYIYVTGEGVRKDPKEGVKWFRKAADQGDVNAQNNLGLAYANGEGLPKNYVEAYKWFNLAAANGSKWAVEARSSLEGDMTPAQIAEAQRLSAKFVPRKAGEKFPPEEGSPPSEIAASATAFFVTEDGYALTSYHVIKQAAHVQLLTPTGVFPASIIKTDAANDIALLKASGKFPSLPLQLSRSVELGETVFTVGFPNIALQGLEPKLTEGKISSLSGVQDDPRYFQISVAVQPGNSGGALVNSKGNVVGVVAAKLSVGAALAMSGSLPENVNYAVKSSYALLLLESVPEVSAKIKEPNTKDRKFEEVVKRVQSASALVIVGY